jgi:16S rRNA (uracil1498-N3)-methyltransferase
VRVPRLVVAGASAGRTLEVGGAGFHHLARVLRRSPGDRLLVLDGQGAVFEGRLESVDAERGVLQVRLGDALPPAAGRISPLAVGLGVVRGDGFERAVRWGSEMGLRRLIPLATRRGVVKLEPGEQASKKAARWRRIALEAAEQCGRPSPLIVDDPASLSELVKRTGEAGSGWIAVPGGLDLDSSGLLEALGGPATAEGKAGSGEEEVLVLVGPEGGWDPLEIEAALAAGFQAVGFPTPVLRTPTAVAYLAALGSLAPALYHSIYKEP